MSTLIVDDDQVQLIEVEGTSEILVLTGERIVDVVQTTEQEVIVTEVEATAVIIEIDGTEVVVTQEEAPAQILTVAEQGPKGAKGDKGDKGDQGDIGPVGPAGPQGPTGTWEEEMPYAKKVDFQNDVILTGKAPVGSLPSSPVWQISRTEFATDDDVSVTWAEGNALFDKVWDNRNTYTYE